MKFVLRAIIIAAFSTTAAWAAPEVTGMSANAYRDVLGQPAIGAWASKKENTLSFARSKVSANLRTTKFQHYYKGLEVVGSMALHHIGRNGVKVDDALARFDLDVNPTVSTDDAVGIVKNLTNDQSLAALPELKILPRMSTPNATDANLVYWAKVRRNGNLPGRQIIIDAHTGEVLANLSNEDNIDIQVYSANSDNTLALQDPDQGDQADQGEPQGHGEGGYGQGYPRGYGDYANYGGDGSGRYQRGYPGAGNSQQQQEQEAEAELERIAATKCQVTDPDGDPIIVNIQNCALSADSQQDGGASSDASAARAVQNAQKVLAYWQKTFGRNSYDDQGSTVVSLIHAGIGWANAFWEQDEKIMAYGDGDGKVLGDMTIPLDVAAHEMTHAVTHSEVDLVRMWESGAVDEAFSDFFGMMVSNTDDWVIGKAAFINQTKSAGIRNLRDPGALTTKIPDRLGRPVTVQYPANINDEIYPQTRSCDGSNDACWVHLNSTIASHAMYLVDQALGQANAEKLYYTVQGHYLTPQESLQKLATDAYSACQALFDASACDQVKTAYAQVGLDVNGGGQQLF